jgi:hypothetical protein
MFRASQSDISECFNYFSPTFAKLQAKEACIPCGVQTREATIRRPQ